MIFKGVFEREVKKRNKSEACISGWASRRKHWDRNRNTNINIICCSAHGDTTFDVEVPNNRSIQITLRTALHHASVDFFRAARRASPLLPIRWASGATLKPSHGNFVWVLRATPAMTHHVNHGLK